MDNIKKNIAENKYYIDHDTKPVTDTDNNFWYDITGANLWSLVALFSIIACTALVAGEFSEGTMKTMIPRPFARWQILTAKFIAILEYTVLLMVVSYVFTLIGVAAFYGTGGAGKPVLLWLGGNIVAMNGFAASLVTMGLDFLSALVYVIFTFALSAVSRSRALATGLSIFLMFAGSLVILLAYNFSWGKYIFFADTEFKSFTIAGAPFYGITLGLALLICAVYSIIFMAAGYFAFAKRDIAG